MNYLFSIQKDQELDIKALSITRIASRAIIYKQESVLMIQSKKYQEYKFPGGGVRPNESLIEGLMREVKEETGFVDLFNITPYGYVNEYRKAIDPGIDIFILKSYYFFCECGNMQIPLELDPYELEYGYEVKWIKPEDAISQNQTLFGNSHIPWVERETAVLESLIKMKNAK